LLRESDCSAGWAESLDGALAPLKERRVMPRVAVCQLVRVLIVPGEKQCNELGQPDVVTEKVVQAFNNIRRF